ncbi:MAG TPA: hypothetical protein P5032_17895, partial [Candidatus Competibacter sp.]|nr:hypothetical protein [Candidatus Competibacter sp.]
MGFHKQNPVINIGYRCNTENFYLQPFFSVSFILSRGDFHSTVGSLLLCIQPDKKGIPNLSREGFAFGAGQFLAVAIRESGNRNSDNWGVARIKHGSPRHRRDYSSVS